MLFTVAKGRGHCILLIWIALAALPAGVYGGGVAGYGGGVAGNVVVLDHSNWERRLSRERMFVQFTATWSQECQQIFNPMIEQLAEKFPGKIARVYCDRDERVCQEAQIRGVPYFAVFDPRLQPWEYQMQNNVDDVAKFLGAAFGIEDPDKEDLYATLEVDKDAPQAAIRKSYRKLSLKYHPDKHAGNTEMKAKFEAIGRAYEVQS
jgi:thiol-disulfide isomerase/thioredoxin